VELFRKGEIYGEKFDRAREEMRKKTGVGGGGVVNGASGLC
jgi:hypothetical protein